MLSSKILYKNCTSYSDNLSDCTAHINAYMYYILTNLLRSIYQRIQFMNRTIFKDLENIKNNFIL